MTVAGLRQLFNLSRYDLAALLGRSEATVRRIEGGKTPGAPTEELLGALQRLARLPQRRRPNLKRILHQHGRLKALKYLCN